jgi:hypothetical protein
MKHPETPQSTPFRHAKPWTHPAKAGFFHLLPLICTLTEILQKTNAILSFLNEINNLDRKLEKNTFKKAFLNKHLKSLFNVTCESG